MAQTLAGALQLEPLLQGDLSYLCGLYSILNAIQLARYPKLLTPTQRKHLFIAGVAYLARKRQLRSVLGRGMEEPIWRGLAEALVQHTKELIGTDLKVRRLLRGSAQRSRRSTLAAINNALEASQPVLVYLGGTLDHYTVISGFTDHRLLLFDSHGCRWIDIDHVGIAEAAERRHWIEPAWTYRLC